jgi:DNA polymerase-1
MPVPKSNTAPEKLATAPASVSRRLQESDHLFLVDGSGYIFRAYHALPPLTRKSDGLQINAVLGFCNMLWKLLNEMKPEDRPTHLAVVFDKSEKTFRTDFYPDYKAHRPPAPDDLIPQFPLIREAVRAFDIPCLEQQGYEADDLIATYARLACEVQATVTIVSSDKDLMQLVNDCVTMYDTMKDRRIGPAEVCEKFGVLPEKVVDVQALIGDSTDNVPGVPGIGVKTAAQLITEYGDLETLLARAGEIKQDKRRQTLIDNAENARISKRLVTLDQNVALEVPVEDLAVHEPDYDKLIAFLKAMEFTSLTRRVAEKSGVDATAIEANASPGGTAPSAAGPKKESGKRGTPGGSPDLFAPAAPALPLKGGANPPVVRPAGPQGNGNLTPAAHAAAVLAAAKQSKFDRAKYETVRAPDRLDAWIAQARDFGAVAVRVAATSIDPMTAQLCGISFAVAANEACYIPLGHRESASAGGDLFSPEAKLCTGQISEEAALAALKPLLETPSVLKIGQNLKFDWLLFARRGIDVFPYDDTMLMSYVLDAGRASHGLDVLAEKWLGHKTIPLEQLTGSGKAQVTFDRVTIERAAEYAAEDADVTLRLWRALKARMPAEHVATVYETLERPLIPVLARMERRGIAIDRQVLSRLSGEFAQKQGGLEDEINKLAGAALNPGSPKQLGDILFGHERWRSWLNRGTNCHARFWIGGRCRNCARPTPTRCRATSMPKPGGCTQITRSLPLRQVGFRHRSPTCRTSRSAPRRDERSAAPSSRSRGRSSFPPITHRSSCDCLPRSPTCRRCARRFRRGWISTP